MSANAPERKSLIATLIRIAICTLLLAWIFQSIFWDEGKRFWEGQEDVAAWSELSRGERLQISWEHGPRELWRNIKQVRGVPFAISLVVMGATILLSVVRWRMVLAVHGLSLSFSRANETQSDEYSVEYLCPTEYDARGAARFFEKLLDAGTPSPPAFLSTHPNPDNRVENITAKWAELGCGEGGTFEARYADFVASLP